jgi:hypothetical protein
MSEHLFPLTVGSLGYADTRLKRGGWAPGNYFGKCISCNCTFTGDKRACSCAPCAYAKPLEEPKPHYTLNDLYEAWNDLNSNFGTHDGECTNSEVCDKCGTKTSKCDLHIEKMAERTKKVNDIFENLIDNEIPQSFFTSMEEMKNGELYDLDNMLEDTSEPPVPPSRPQIKMIKEYKTEE